MAGNFFDRLNDTIREAESSLVNFLSTFAPWIAPLTPAYMTFQHAQSALNFPLYIAAPAALLVEILGFSTVSTFMAFYFYNRKNKAEAKKAPIWWVIAAFLFYLCLILFSNVLLDAFPDNGNTLIVVRALYTLQTVPAAFLVAVRVQHRDLLKEYAREKEVSRNLPKTREDSDEENGNFPKVSENLPKDWRSLRPTLSEQDVANLAQTSPTDIRRIAIQYRVSERTVTNWRSYARSELGLDQTQ